MTELHGMHGLALFAAAVAGLAIAHRAVLQLPTGIPRLIIILPILPIFFMLPWTIPIYHLRAILSFIFLWTVPSKLLLLCWDAGIDYPSSGFLYFATIVMLPIRVKGKKAKKQACGNTHNRQYWWQFIAVIVILNIYSYRNGLPLWAIYVLYACHIYLGLELMLGGLAKLATACFGVESDPQFNNPFMSASLSEFWGRRWNLVVTTILRSTVYNPALLLLMRAEKQNSCAQTSSECKPQSSQERVNAVANCHPCSTHCNGSAAASTNNSPANESESHNSSSSEHGGTHCDSQAVLGNSICAEPLHANQNGHSLVCDPKILSKSDDNPKPDHSLPSPSSEVSKLEAEDCIKGGEMPSEGIAATANGCYHNPINPAHCVPNPNSDCNSEASPIISDPTSETTPYPDVKKDPILSECSPNPTLLDCSCHPNPTECFPDPKLPACNPNPYNPDPLLSNPNPNPNSGLDPAICRDGVETGIIRGTMKPSLRARAVAILARAATKPNLLSPNPFAKSDPSFSDTDPTANPNPKSRPDPELHPAMYKIATDEKGVMGSRSREKPSLRAKAVAMLVTFAVSGLVHELIFYYINKSRATGEVTAFFVLHGCATAIELLLKKTMMAQVQLPRPISIALTLSFLYATAAWLFMPPLIRNGADINTIAEYQRLQSALISFFFNR